MEECHTGYYTLITHLEPHTATDFLQLHKIVLEVCPLHALLELYSHTLTCAQSQTHILCVKNPPWLYNYTSIQCGEILGGHDQSPVRHCLLIDRPLCVNSFECHVNNRTALCCQVIQDPHIGHFFTEQSTDSAISQLLSTVKC